MHALFHALHLGQCCPKHAQFPGFLHVNFLQRKVETWGRFTILLIFRHWCSRIEVTINYLPLKFLMIIHTFGKVFLRGGSRDCHLMLTFRLSISF